MLSEKWFEAFLDIELEQRDLRHDLGIQLNSLLEKQSELRRMVYRGEVLGEMAIDVDNLLAVKISHIEETIANLDSVVESRLVNFEED